MSSAAPYPQSEWYRAENQRLVISEDTPEGKASISVSWLELFDRYYSIVAQLIKLGGLLCKKHVA